MSSLVTVSPGYEVATEDNFRRRIKEFKELGYKELEEMRRLSNRLHKDTQVFIINFFSEKLNELVGEYQSLKGSYLNGNATAFNAGFRKVIDEYNKTILLLKTLIKEVEIISHLKGIDFYRQLVKPLKDKINFALFLKVYLLAILKGKFQNTKICLLIYQVGNSKKLFFHI